MGVSKVEIKTENGLQTIMDLTNDTVTEETLAKGVTAHDANGNPIEGIMETTTVLYTEQTLTEEQKSQARENIDAPSVEDLDSLSEEIADYKTLTLGTHTDGKTYIFINGEPTGTGIEQGASGDVVGYIEADNTIVLTGGIPKDENYTMKFKMEDGTLVDAGNLIFVADPVEPVNQFVATTDWINKVISSNGGAWQARNAYWGVEVSGIDLSAHNPYIIRISGATPAIDSSDSAYGRIALLNSSGGLVKFAYVTSAILKQDGDSWYLNLYDISSDPSVTICRLCIALNTNRTAITLTDVANLFVEFEPLNV